MLPVSFFADFSACLEYVRIRVKVLAVSIPASSDTNACQDLHEWGWCMQRILFDTLFCEEKPI